MHRYLVNKRDPWTKFLEAWQELGFQITYYNQFECHDVVTDGQIIEDEVVLYSQGFIVYMNSYTNEDGIKCVNRSHLYGEVANTNIMISLKNNILICQYCSIKHDDSNSIIIESINPHLHFYPILVLIRKCRPLNKMSHSHEYICFMNYAESENLGIYTKEDLKRAEIMIDEINRSKIEQFTIPEAKSMIVGRSR